MYLALYDIVADRILFAVQTRPQIAHMLLLHEIEIARKGQRHR